MNINEDIPFDGPVHPVALGTAFFRSIRESINHLDKDLLFDAMEQNRSCCTVGVITSYPSDITIPQLSKTATDIIDYYSRHVSKKSFSKRLAKISSQLNRLLNFGELK